MREQTISIKVDGKRFLWAYIQYEPQFRCRNKMEKSVRNAIDDAIKAGRNSVEVGGRVFTWEVIQEHDDKGVLVVSPDETKVDLMADYENFEVDMSLFGSSLPKNKNLDQSMKFAPHWPSQDTEE